MSKPPTRWRAAIALAAAYALVLQAFLAAAPGADGIAAGFDSAHVLCLATGGGDPPGRPADSHRDDCCVLCAASPAGPGAAPAAIGLPDYPAAMARLAPATAASLPGKPARSPIHARAPPPAA
jgi:hypothetical protein